jgi:hypothetical protein
VKSNPRNAMPWTLSQRAPRIRKQHRTRTGPRLKLWMPFFA